MRIWMSVARRLGAAVALWASAPGLPFAAEPFRTDDPDPGQYQHYEFFTEFMGTHVRDGTSGIGPAWEFNYGLIPNGQIHFLAPLAFNDPTGRPSQFGYGDTELGFKYRFIDEDKNGSRPMIGTAPLLDLPTGDQRSGLGTGHARMFLPLWVEKNFADDWVTYGGGGYWINHGDGSDDRDYWYFGWVLQKQVTKQLAIGGELFHQTANKIGGKDSTAFNIGATYDFDDRNHLLVSAGTGIQNASETNLFSWYISYKITGP